MKNVLVLGASGMLGSMVVDLFSRQSEIAVTASVRNAELKNALRTRFPGVRWVDFDFAAQSSEATWAILDGQQWIINAIGITKPLVRDDNPEQIETAISVNSLLPHALGRRAASVGARVLQIATDCVYSGSKGMYRESDTHDALDVYGKTKSLGESFQPNVHHLRCSIIGPEPKDFKFLLEWFLRQPRTGQVNGFTNHRWNGVTTLHFAKACLGIISRGISLTHLQHVVPNDPLPKSEMLKVFASVYGREDIRVQDVEAKSVIDRTLATDCEERNRALWQAAGYDHPPTVKQMIEELGAYDYRAVV